jgi:hypothetical protein
MDHIAIKTRLNALTKAMLGKGLKQPSAQFDIENDTPEVRIYLKWADPTKVASRSIYSDGLFKFIKNEDPESAFDEADAFIAELPSAEEAKLRQFMGALGAVIDLGKDNGVEVEFLNPLQKTMKKLSDNILTDQRMQAAE